MEPDFDKFLSKGILFHENAKILLAEKFVNVEFLIPFPRYNFTAKEAIEETLHKLSNMWNIPSVFCPFDFSSQFNTSTDQFNVNWLLDKIQSETHEAEQTVKNLHATTSKLLAENPDKSARDRRGAPVVAAAALAGICLFGSGVAMGSSPGKATNLGYGIWLLTSTSPAFTLREYSVDNSNVPHNKEYPGCTVCLITLECEAQLISKFIKFDPISKVVIKFQLSALELSSLTPWSI